MSNDLISRRALIQSLRNNVLVDVTPNLEQAIAEQPTAYDVDKVLYELEEARFPITDLRQGIKVNGVQQTDDAVLYERALGILKYGLHV
jgi:hypothetical protein